jgi:TatD DNase family protein
VDKRPRRREETAMIDTHCHLTDPRIAEQLDGVLFRAAAAGVTRMITISLDVADARRCVDLCRGRPNVRCAVGVHPNHVAQVERDELPALRDIQADPSVVAIGEIGLDYHYGREHRDRQVEFFNAQLELATAVGRPVVIHCREAIDDCLAILRGFPEVRAVFHCFTGTAAEGHRVLDAGYMVGFTGVVTFKNGGELRQLAAEVEADRYLVETDSPYLSPEPLRRQKVNEPALVVHVAATVAAARGLTVAQVDEQSTRNAAALFGWPALDEGGSPV